MPNNKTASLPFILYLPQQICSRLLYDDANQTASLFTMDRDESISEEQQDCPSIYMMLQGELRLQLTITQQADPDLHRHSSHSQAAQAEIALKAGESVRLPARLRHSIHAVTQCAYIKLQTNFAATQLIDTDILQSNTIKHLGGNYMSDLLINKLPHGEVISLANSIEYVAGQVTSKTLVQRPELGMTLFAVDEGQQIRRHVTSGDALAQILEGTAEIEIGDGLHVVQAGQSIVMPAGIPHALYGKQSFKMLLIVVKAAAQKG